MAGETDLNPGQLPFSGPAGQLQVALQHLRNTMQPPITERAAPGRNRKSGAGRDGSALDEVVRLPDGTVTERLEPQVDERRKPVIQLGQVDVADARDPSSPTAARRRPDPLP